jgi:hypothetical protein
MRAFALMLLISCRPYYEMFPDTFDRPGAAAAPPAATADDAHQGCVRDCKAEKHRCDSNVAAGTMLKSGAPGFEPPPRDCSGDFQACLNSC